MSGRGYIIGELGWRQEDQISTFSKFQAREAGSSGMYANNGEKVKRGPLT